MELRFMTEEQLLDIFMTEFPATMPIDECREKLEMEIYFAAKWLGDDPDDPESTVCISPMYVWLAIQRMHLRKRNYRPIEEFEKRFNHGGKMPERDRKRAMRFLGFNV